jgi:preprotein translocase subunit SecF
MFDITGKRFWFFLTSGIAILISIVSLLTFGLKAGIEFSSGSLMTVSFEQDLNQDALREELANLGYANVIIQRAGETDFLIRLPELNTAAKVELEAGLSEAFSALEVKEFDVVSPMIAGETTRNAAIAVAVAAVGPSTECPTPSGTVRVP